MSLEFILYSGKRDINMILNDMYENLKLSFKIIKSHITSIFIYFQVFLLTAKTRRLH